MLDVLLGRGFSSKCKSSIKLINVRIEVIKKKRSAMVRYLRKDVADLLIEGQDINAFNRIEALITEQNLLWGYDMIEQYCGCIHNQLSYIQKKREWPPEVREAVAGLMFAAARFADLPELRTLRAIFTDRYGDALTTAGSDSHSNCSSVNQEFVDKVSSNSPSMDTKLQLMRKISKEYSIKWDSKAFEQKISSQNAYLCDLSQKLGSFRYSSENAPRNLPDNVRGEKAIEMDNKETPSHRRPGLPTLGYIRQQEMVDSRDNLFRRENNRTSNHRQTEPARGYTKKQEKVEKREDVPVPNIKDSPNNYPLDLIDNTKRIPRAAVIKASPNITQNSMPPYVKPRSNSKCEPSPQARHVGPNHKKESSDQLSVNNGACEYKSERRTHAGSYERQVGGGSKSLGGHRKHLKQPVNRNRSLRDRRGSVRGNGVDRDDDSNDEAIMDELLIHYSQKPTYKENKMSVGMTGSPADVSQSSLLSSQSRKRDGALSHSGAGVPHLNRVKSLPTGQVNPAKEGSKGYVRANSLKPNMFNARTGHVHPKLPDYDDLAARIAALRKG